MSDLPLTKEEWNDYVNATYPGGSDMFGYIDATEQIINVLEQIVNDPNPLEQLRENVRTFCNQRRELLKFANANWPK